MILDIIILTFVFGSGAFGAFYAIRLRLHSKKIAMENKQEDQEILRIFEELERKAAEINPELLQQTKAFNTNEAIESYREYIYNSVNQTTALTTSTRVLI